MTSQPTDQHLIEYLFDHHRSLVHHAWPRPWQSAPLPCGTQMPSVLAFPPTPLASDSNAWAPSALRGEHRTTVSSDMARLQSGTSVAPPSLTGRITPSAT
jgi:hypothetical protein